MKKMFILLSLIGVAAPIVASLGLDESYMAVNVHNVEKDIIVTVDGGIAPYNVEISGQLSQVGDGPQFIFPDVTAGSYEVSVTDSDDPTTQRFIGHEVQ